MKKVFYILSAALLMAACTKENSPVQGVNGSEPVYKTISAQIITDAPKTTMSISDGKVIWSEGDQIGLIDGAGTITSAALVEGAGTVSANFTYDCSTLDGDPAYAFYPYDSLVTVSNGVITITLPETQTIPATVNVADGIAIMGGQVASTAVAFKNVCSVLCVKLTGEETIDKVMLRSEASVLSGKGTVDLKETSPVFVPASTASHQVTAVADSEITLSSTATSVCFVVPAGTYNDLKVVTEGNSGSAFKLSTKAHTLTASHVHPLGPIAIARAMAGTDLSETETSNCYIVDPATEADYKFDAKLVDGTTVNGKIADVLWQSVAGLVDNVEYDALAGQISFRKTGTSVGNAIIGLLDEDHKVVWSWHIWISTVNDHWLTAPAGERLFNDRNLGATYTPTSKTTKQAMTDTQAAATCGFYYQFGNHTPFPTVASVDKCSKYKYENNAASSGKPFADGYTQLGVFSKYYGYKSWDRTNYNKTVAEMAAYPFSFNKILDKDGATNIGSWASDATATGGLWNAATKTNQDPCPAGYHVPDYSEIFALRNSDITDSNTATKVLYQHNAANRIPAASRKITQNGTTYTEIYWSDGANAYYNGNSDKFTSIRSQFIYIPFAGFRTSGYNNITSNSYQGPLLMVGYYFGATSGVGGWKTASTCQYWTYDKSGDTKTTLASCALFHDKPTKQGADVVQRVGYMIGQISSVANKAYHNGNWYTSTAGHFISAAVPVRCCKVKPAE